jgi:hypothetical protein
VRLLYTYYTKDAVADDGGTLYEGRQDIAKVNRFSTTSAHATNGRAR